MDYSVPSSFCHLSRKILYYNDNDGTFADNEKYSAYKFLYVNKKYIYDVT